MPNWEREESRLASLADRARKEQEAAKRRTRPEFTAAVRCMYDIKPEPITWLWEPRIASGKVTVISGDPGLGKSMISVALAAAVSTGARWPVDGTQAPMGDVIILNAEDDAADTIRPRLDASGADPKRVFVLDAITIPTEDGPKEHTFSLRDDVEVLDRLLLDMPETKLVTIDPVSAYLGSIDSHNNSEVRALLAPLAALASRRKVAIVAVTHLNKGGGPAMYRTTGSLAFVAAARAVYAVTKCKENSQRRLMLPVKNNLGPDQGGLAYAIMTAENGAPYVAWENEPVTISAEDALAPAIPDEERTERDEAVDWLKKLLKDGPLSAKDVQKHARDAGIAWRTIERAKKVAGVKSEKSSKEGPWRWSISNFSQDRQDEDRQPPSTQNHGGLGDCGGLDEESTTYEDGLERQFPKTAKTAKPKGYSDVGSLHNDDLEEFEI